MTEPEANQAFPDLELKEPQVRLTEKGEAPTRGGALQVSTPSQVDESAAMPATTALAEKPAGNLDRPLPNEPIPNIKPYRGLFRHRLIVAGCALASLSVLFLSALDLRGLNQSAATFDESLNLKMTPKMPTLSPDLQSGSYRVVDDRIVIQDNSWSTNLSGLADGKGNVVVRPQYYEVHEVSDGMAYFKEGPSNDEEKAGRVSRDYKIGFLDKNGKVAIKPQFTYAEDFHGGVALVNNDTLIDKTGKVLFKAPNEGDRSRSVHASNPFDTKELTLNGNAASGLGSSERLRAADGVFVYRDKDNNAGLVDAAGHIISSADKDEIIPLSYDFAYGVRDMRSYTESETNSNPDRSKLTYMRFLKDGKWGLMDSLGRQVVPANYTRLLSFANGHAAVMIDGKYGFIDGTGRIVIPAQYDYVTAFDKVIAVKQNNIWHFIDASGKTLPLPTVDGVLHTGQGSWMADGLGAVVKDNKVGYLNKKGFVIQPKFDFGLAFHSNHAAVFEGGLWHFINSSGARVSPDLADSSTFANGLHETNIPGPLYKFFSYSIIDSQRKEAARARDIAKDNKILDQSKYYSREDSLF